MENRPPLSSGFGEAGRKYQVFTKPQDLIGQVLFFPGERQFQTTQPGEVGEYPDAVMLLADYITAPHGNMFAGLFLGYAATNQKKEPLKLGELLSSNNIEPLPGKEDNEVRFSGGYDGALRILHKNEGPFEDGYGLTLATRDRYVFKKSLRFSHQPTAFLLGYQLVSEKSLYDDLGRGKAQIYKGSLESLLQQDIRKLKFYIKGSMDLLSYHQAQHDSRYLM